MFTGLVQEVGTIADLRGGGGVTRVDVRCAFDDLITGESIAVNGVCLTVVDSASGRFVAEIVSTTLHLTTARLWRAGLRVNLERALKLGDRLGGHLVQGHVDGVGTVVGVRRESSDKLLSVRVSPGVAAATVPRGSIALDGVSLTVAHMHDADVVEVALIPHTLDATTLGERQEGDLINVEGDVFGKYALRLLSPYTADRQQLTTTGVVQPG